MKTIGEFITERRKELSLSQKELAALIKNRDGQPLSTPYLSYLENGRGEPPAYLLDQFAKVLRVKREVFHFWTNRMPSEVATGETKPEHVTAAYRAFRGELKGRGGSSRGKKRRS
ncbi:MAG: helix-turn-helix transcriptional regulator [Deltaproteobacteria bacterium]|nr:helix-turn-helix transcriptional regulator [Deltaproteobacteria bacterium]